MAKKITNCGWGCEVIEGMDLWLQEYLTGKKPDLGNSVSAFSARSKHPFTDKLSKATANFNHLEPNGYAHYRNNLTNRSDFLDWFKSGLRTPRPKIIVLDKAWEDETLLSDKAIFLTQACRDINNIRRKPWPGDESKDPTHYSNPYLKHRQGHVYNPDSQQFELLEGVREIDHGAACVAALRISDTEPRQKEMIGGYLGDPNDQATMEAKLWNLSSRADIVLLPLREHAEVDRSAYNASIKNAQRVQFIDQDHYEAFIHEDTHALLNASSIEDNSKSIETLVQIVGSKVNAGIYPVTDDGTVNIEIDDTPLLRLVIKHVERLIGEGGVADLPKVIEGTIKKTVARLFQSTSHALEEAGLDATLKLVTQAADNKKLGRGDTLVVPMEIRFWEKRPASSKHSEADIFHFSGSQLEAQDFLRDRPTLDDGPELPENIDQRRSAEDIHKIYLPIIAYRKIEEKVKTMTCQHKISVIVSGGNSFIDLGQISVEKLDILLPTKRFENLTGQKRRDEVEREDVRLFGSRGAYCGAIIVGSGIPRLSDYWMDPLNFRFTPQYMEKRELVHAHAEGLKNAAHLNADQVDHRQFFANFGLVVNVSGRASATEVLHYDERVVSKEIYYHWQGASIAAIVAAACLANVQQIRMVSDFINRVKFNEKKVAEPNLLRPLKPFEARAHFEQWRSNEAFKYDCLADLMGAPPDIRAWFEGSCYFDELTAYAVEGAKKIGGRNSDP